MTRDTGENEIPVALVPHLGICSANSAVEDREADMARRDNRLLCIFPQLKLLRSGQLQFDDTLLHERFFSNSQSVNCGISYPVIDQLLF